MAQILSSAANEQSTYIVSITPTDENGDAVTVNAMTWTLTDLQGNVINSRLDVALTPATVMYIVLSASDLALYGKDTETRAILVEGDYDSSLGSNLPLKEEIRFDIVNFVGLT